MTIVRRSTRVVATVVASIGLAGFQQAPPRDLPTASRGTASIAGVVVDRETGQPIRHAEVWVNSTPPARPQMLNTDDDGRFQFDSLPAATYTLGAASPVHVRMLYGASSQEGPGAPIVIADGQRLTSLVVPLVPAAAIGGTITNAAGTPQVNAYVTLWRWGYSAQTGRRTLSSLGGSSTDDRGRYRVLGLAPGEYLVATNGQPLRLDGPAPGQDRDVLVIRHADVEAIRRGQLPPRVEPSREAVPGARSIVVGPLSEPASTYFPGVTRPSEASAITLGAGEDRAGVDFPIRSVVTASVMGRLAYSGGVAPVRTVVSLYPVDEYSHSYPTSTNYKEESREFEFSGVAPGDYVISAQAYLTDGRPDSSVAPVLLFGTLRLSIDSRDVRDLVVTMQSGVTVSGRVQYAGAPPPPEVASRMRIDVTAIVAPGEVVATSAPVPIGAAGEFVITGVPPGRFVLTLSAASGGGATTVAPWAIRTAIVSGINAADVAVEIGSTPISDVAVTLTNSPGELSGKVSGAGGVAINDRWIVVFSPDRATWRPGSRRVTAARPSADGIYRVTNLPAGEYVIAVVTNVERGQWFNPEFLDQLFSPSLPRVTVAEGERKTQDLVIR